MKNGIDTLARAELEQEYAHMVRGIAAECEAALLRIRAEETALFLRELYAAQRIFFVGVGRVMMALAAIAKRLAHLGFATHCVGDVNEPAITPADLLVVASGSGESLIPVAIARKAKALGARVVWIGARAGSSVGASSDLAVRIPVGSKAAQGTPEDVVLSMQPMTSLFEQVLLLYGDTLAALMAKHAGETSDQLWKAHANLE